MGEQGESKKKVSPVVVPHPGTRVVTPGTLVARPVEALTTSRMLSVQHSIAPGSSAETSSQSRDQPRCLAQYQGVLEGLSSCASSWLLPSPGMRISGMRGGIPASAQPQQLLPPQPPWWWWCCADERLAKPKSPSDSYLSYFITVCSVSVLLHP